MASKVNVTIAPLSRDMITVKVVSGSSVAKVLEDNDLEATGDIFINAKKASLDSKVKAGDIIGIVGEVDGGC